MSVGGASSDISAPFARPHQRTIEQAADDVKRFVQDARARDIRCVLVTHGKAAGAPEPATLKSYVCYWLDQMTDVIAWHSAQARHGGAGAVYVLLRKSESRKRENRERFNR